MSGRHRREIPSGLMRPGWAQPELYTQAQQDAYENHRSPETDNRYCDRHAARKIDEIQDWLWDRSIWATVLNFDAAENRVVVIASTPIERSAARGFLQARGFRVMAILDK